MILDRDRTFQGTAQECAVAAFGDAAQVEAVSQLEHRVDWDQNGFSGYVTDVTLRSGMEILISEARASHSLTLPMDGSPTGLSISLCRGTGLTVNVEKGTSYLSGGGTLEVSQIKQTVEMSSTLAPGAHNECVVLQLAPELMCQLLGVELLPGLVRGVVESEEPFSRAALPMGVELFRLLDELLHCSAEGLSRQLYLEGKALEILARVFDLFHAESHTPVHVLPPADVARLHRVRKALVAQLDSPPSLQALSRDAGLSQTKLKADFRVLFGCPVYTYLRDRRMTEAHRLLGEGNLSVSEVSVRVGYANPSKFATAFRKQFGQPPSVIRGARPECIGTKGVPE